MRLYVTYAGKPGVWFLSLDAANALAVYAACRLFHLPYFKAAMPLTATNTTFHFQSERQEGMPLYFKASYRATLPPYTAQPNTLETG